MKENGVLGNRSKIAQMIAFCLKFDLLVMGKYFKSEYEKPEGLE